MISADRLTVRLILGIMGQDSLACKKPLAPRLPQRQLSPAGGRSTACRTLARVVGLRLGLGSGEDPYGGE